MNHSIHSYSEGIIDVSTIATCQSSKINERQSISGNYNVNVMYICNVTNMCRHVHTQAWAAHNYTRVQTNFDFQGLIIQSLRVHEHMVYVQ